MSNPALSNVLTSDRLADLRLIAIGATRRPDGSPFEPQRNRLAWLAKHGYITIQPAPPGSRPAQRRACVKVTEKGHRAIADDDARQAARREMVP